MWPFHRHRYTEVDREHLNRRPWIALLQEFAEGYSPVTLITERCIDQKCRKWRQVRLDGHVGAPRRKEVDEVGEAGRGAS